MEREGRRSGGRRPSRSTPCCRPPSGRTRRGSRLLPRCRGSALSSAGAARRAGERSRHRRPATRTTRSAARRSRSARSLSAGTTESTPAAPTTTPSQPSPLGSSAVRSAATLTSRTHRPPRSSPPDPPRPCATGSIACQVATAWAGAVAWSSTTAAMPALKTIPLAVSTTAQTSPADGRRLGEGRRAVLQARVQGQRQDGEDEAEDHVGDQVHDLHARVLAHDHGHLLGGVHDIGVLHEQEEERHGDQIGHCHVEGRDAPEPSAFALLQRRTGPSVTPFSGRRVALPVCTPMA